MKSCLFSGNILTVRLSTYRKCLIYTKEDQSFTFDPSFALAAINTSNNDSLVGIWCTC